VLQVFPLLIQLIAITVNAKPVLEISQIYHLNKQKYELFDKILPSNIVLIDLGSLKLNNNQ